MGDKDIAISTYAAGGSTVRTALEAIFGKKIFQPIMERIKTWEDAADEYGIDPVESLPYIMPVNARQEAINAFFKLDVISEVLCEGVLLDWANANQKKWYPGLMNIKRVRAFGSAIRISFGRVRMRLAGLAFAYLPSS